MSSCLIFPNQLFELKYFPKDNVPRKVYLLEEPVLFGYRNKKLNFNKLKLVLHRSSMKYYESYLKKNNIDVEYLEFNDLKTSTSSGYKKIKSDKSSQLLTFNLTDHFLEKKMKKLFPNIMFLENPNFLVSQTKLKEYYDNNKSKKIINQGNFFNWVKSEIDVLTNVKSYDTENRNPLPNNVKIPVLGTSPSEDKKIIKEAIDYITNHPVFKDNYGPDSENLADNCWFPVRHSSSEEWLKKFIKERLSKFGDYQDAIILQEVSKNKEGARSLFHSLIAPMFNIGLLSPHQIVEEIMKEKSNKSIGMNNIEGFLRQIIGWREYQRYCYLFYYDEMTKPNIFGNKGKLTKSLYDGTTGVPPVDEAIKDAFNYGYLHHIQRLMVMSNFFNLINLNPNESYKWFMEFSLDSYDWLMIQNVYSMGMWADGGLSMRKPYISTASYVLKMCNVTESNVKTKKEGTQNTTATTPNQLDWIEVWKALFYNKISHHSEIFRKTPYIFQLKVWEKMNKDEQTRLLKIANTFIKNI
jgi:deoxyribodipyrimidine photolyase-related protein